MDFQSSFMIMPNMILVPHISHNNSHTIQIILLLINATNFSLYDYKLVISTVYVIWWHNYQALSCNFAFYYQLTLSASLTLFPSFSRPTLCTPAPLLLPLVKKGYIQRNWTMSQVGHYSIGKHFFQTCRHITCMFVGQINHSVLLWDQMFLLKSWN